MEASLRAYRTAMEIASKARLDDLDPPAFSEEPQMRRYALPHDQSLPCLASSVLFGPAEPGYLEEDLRTSLPQTLTFTFCGQADHARRARAGFQTWPASRPWTVAAGQKLEIDNSQLSCLRGASVRLPGRGPKSKMEFHYES